MDLDAVSAFARVVSTGSFTAAARELGLPKSSISRTVARLEEQLGVRLLQRTTRRLHLTEAGQAYFSEIEPALRQLSDANRAATRLGKEPRGTIRVTAPVDLGALALADIIAAFVHKYPRIHVDLSLSAKHVDLVAEGFDLAVRAASRMDDSSLVARKVGSTALGLYASADYLKRRGDPTTLAALREHDCILFRGKNGRATWQLQGPQGPEDVEVKGPVNVDEMLFVREAVQAGIGIGRLPTFQLNEKCALGAQPIRVLPRYTVGGAGLFVVTSSLRNLPARVTLFRDALISALSARQWSPS
ncbi:MAG TPA: LysR substrate-binding domain-containing protein [Polyangiaceae bacterium]|nr:LysR substrate-binding domain-containing protein [Polyangiaceae bacterium]